ncbi:hypothetical protein GYH30_024354 [Glycine max]|uniref:Uncharacterized protein n=1 Tax=Glycine max TaxID=3847 RepID=K7LCD3_SOYBN|nr:hypothetical protein GYH30_024354 [Glycine max]
MSAPSIVSSSAMRCIVDAIPSKEWEKLQRILFVSAKDFSIGAGLKGGLTLFAILARLHVKSRQAILAALKETLRYGLFLETFVGTFVSTDEVIGSIVDHHRHWRALVAGAVAGSSMLLIGLEDQHTSLAIYILMRATPLMWKHGDIFLMCLSFSQILYSAYILKQDSLPTSYKSFLNKHGGKDPVILQGVKDIASGKPFTNLGAIEKYYKTMGIDIVHGNKSCRGHILSFLVQAYQRALSVYLPVYLIAALIVHRNGLLKR